MSGRPTSCCRIGCRRCLSISLTVWNTCFLSLNQSIKGTEGHHLLVLLAKLEEILIVDGQRFELSANQYPGVIHPQGQQYLQQFRLELEKSVFMVHGENTTVIQYAMRPTHGDTSASASPGSCQCKLEVRPLIAFRD